jgi:aminoglycoside phosphotransferase (APT) family kinase protein
VISPPPGGTPPPLQSDALGAIPVERLQLAADRHGLGRVLAAEALGGTYGNNAGFDTDGGRWVLRALVPPLDPDALHRERFFARVLHERARVASPWPYLVDDSDEIFGWPYAIMRRLPGKVLHPALEVNWARVGAALGRVVADLHAVTFATIGDWSRGCDGIVAPGMSPAEWFRRRAGELIDRVAETSSPLDGASAGLVNGLVDDALPGIGGFDPAYVHGDLGVGNLVGERLPGGFAFTGVFDLGGGCAGDPDEDLATPLWWPLYWRNEVAPRAFLDAYRAIRPARPGEAPRLRAYVAVSMLRNWEAGRRLGFDWYGGSRTFREWALPLLEKVDAILR